MYLLGALGVPHYCCPAVPLMLWFCRPVLKVLIKKCYMQKVSLFGNAVGTNDNAAYI